MGPLRRSFVSRYCGVKKEAIILRENANSKLKRLALTERLKYAGLFLLVELLAVAGFLLYRYKTGREFTHPSGFVWLAIMLLPFLLKFHKRIFDFGVAGKVKAIRAIGGSERTSYMARSYTPGFLMPGKDCDIRVVQIVTDGKRIREVVLVGPEAGLADYYYRVGDDVVKYPGLKYPVNLSSPRDENFCPACGHFSRPGDLRCYACKRKTVSLKD